MEMNAVPETLTRLNVFVHLCMCVRMYVRMKGFCGSECRARDLDKAECVCAFVHVYVCKNIYIYVCVCVCTYMYIYIHMCVCVL